MQNNAVIQRISICEDFLVICDITQLKQLLSVISENTRHLKKTSIFLHPPYYRTGFDESTINKIISLNESFSQCYTTIKSDELCAVIAKIANVSQLFYLKKTISVLEKSPRKETSSKVMDSTFVLLLFVWIWLFRRRSFL